MCIYIYIVDLFCMHEIFFSLLELLGVRLYLTTSTTMLSTLKLRGSSFSFLLSVMQMAMTKMVK